MDHRTLARDFLALFCAGQGIATVLIDLNRTHATNPEWARHARFHLVWQVLTTLLLSAFEVALVVRGGLYADERFYLAFTLTCIPLLAFLAALLGRRSVSYTHLDVYKRQRSSRPPAHRRTR